MKIEVDTIGDSIDEIKRTISLLQEVLEKRTGVTPEGIKSPLRPSEYKKDEPKIIFEDIMNTSQPKKTTQIKITTPLTKDEIKKRKFLRQDEKSKENEEEDEDRKLPLIPIKDYW
ncbi:MAG: hypothetical protein WC758_03205 [Candidatus Woesearchaeota archaeon]|jgi:hypothetical protein